MRKSLARKLDRLVETAAPEKRDPVTNKVNAAILKVVGNHFRHNIDQFTDGNGVRDGEELILLLEDLSESQFKGIWAAIGSDMYAELKMLAGGIHHTNKKKIDKVMKKK